MILSNIIVPNLASAMQNWRNSWKTTVRRLPKWKILHIARQKRRDYKKTRHTVGFDVERKAYEMWGVNVLRYRA